MEILNGIKVVKLFSLEDVQYKRIINSRNRELRGIKSFAYTLAFLIMISTVIPAIITIIAFSALIGY